MFLQITAIKNISNTQQFNKRRNSIATTVLQLNTKFPKYLESIFCRLFQETLQLHEGNNQMKTAPGGVGGNEAGVVDEGEEGGLQQLDDDERAADPHQGDPGKTN